MHLDSTEMELRPTQDAAHADQATGQVSFFKEAEAVGASESALKAAEAENRQHQGAAHTDAHP